MNDRLDEAMNDPDSWVIRCHYTDRNGKETLRVISPVRWIDAKRILALCLCREEPRHFETARMRHVELVPAESVMMPEPIVEFATERKQSDDDCAGAGGRFDRQRDGLPVHGSESIAAVSQQPPIDQPRNPERTGKGIDQVSTAGETGTIAHRPTWKPFPNPSGIRIRHSDD